MLTKPKQHIGLTATMAVWLQPMTITVAQYSSRELLYSVREIEMDGTNLCTSPLSTVAPDCYGPPQMLILVFIKFRENQE